MGMPKRLVRLVRLVRRVQLAFALPLLLVELGVSACGQDQLDPPAPVADSALYWTLELDRRAVTLALTAPYDTATITAVPRNQAGEALEELPTPTYTSRDPERVSVTADGRLVALASTGSDRVVVVATMTAGNLKHKDSAFVKVTETAPWVLDSFSVQPLPPDSAKFAALFPLQGPVLPVRAIATDGTLISDLLVNFRSADASVLDIEAFTGQIHGSRPGVVTLTANTTAFGVTKADTLAYRIGWPLYATVSVQSGHTFNKPAVTIGVGGIIQWTNYKATAGPDASPMHILFSDPTNVGMVGTPVPNYLPNGFLFCEIVSALDCTATGDMELDVYYVANSDDNDFPLLRRSSGVRRFGVPGIYDYHTEFGTGGRVVVVDER